MAKKKTGLGMGLSALLGEDTPELTLTNEGGAGAEAVPVEFLQAGKFQPRLSFDEDEISRLAASIKEQGILQPLLLRKISEDEYETRYEIIAGERRWRAAQMAGLHEVPAIVREMSDQQALEIALIENVQRQDLSALEEAMGYQRLIDEFGYTQEDLAKGVGKSRSHIANLLRLLSLPDEIKQMVDKGELTAGHARALLGAPNPVEAAKIVIQKGFNVRQTEQFVRRLAEEKAPRLPLQKDPDTLALEEQLKTSLGMTVSIRNKGQKGSLTIQYKDLDQLDQVLKILTETEAA